MEFDVLIFLAVLAAAAAAWVITDLVTYHLRSNVAEKPKPTVRKYGNEKRK